MEMDSAVAFTILDYVSSGVVDQESDPVFHEPAFGILGITAALYVIFW